MRSLTYFEDWGPRGISDAAGEPYPVTTAIELLLPLEGRRVRTGSSVDGLVWLLASEGGDVLIANLDTRDRPVIVPLSWGTRTVDLAPSSVTRLR